MRRAFEPRMLDGRISEHPADRTRLADVERVSVVKVEIVRGYEERSGRSDGIHERIQQAFHRRRLASTPCIPRHAGHISHQLNRVPRTDTHDGRPFLHGDGRRGQWSRI